MIRRIAEQLADSFAPRFGDVVNDSTRSFVREEIATAILKWKYWLSCMVVAQLVAAAPIIFFLGGIYKQNGASLDAQREIQSELAQRGLWMQEREKFEMSLEQWAIERGYRPSRYVRGKEPPP